MVFSVLFEPFAEVDLDELRVAPEEGYFADLMTTWTAWRRIGQIDPARARHLVVRSAADLEAAQSTGRMAFVDCVEGGFHLGRTPAVDRRQRRGAGTARRQATSRSRTLLPSRRDQRAGAAEAQRRHVRASGASPRGANRARRRRGHAMYEQRMLSTSATCARRR